jgi:hypothetical protein
MSKAGASHRISEFMNHQTAWLLMLFSGPMAAKAAAHALHIEKMNRRSKATGEMQYEPYQ